MHRARVLLAQLVSAEENPFRTLELQLPEPSSEEVREVAREHFGLNVRETPRDLGSSQDCNLKILTSSDSTPQPYVFKISNERYTVLGVDLENKAMLHAAEFFARVPFDSENKRHLTVPSPLPVIDFDNKLPEAYKFIAQATLNKKKHFVRVLTFLSGRRLDSFLHLGLPVLKDLGKLCAFTVSAFEDFTHPELDNQVVANSRWLARNSLLVTKAFLPNVADTTRRQSIQNAINGAWALISPVATKLKTQVIHADLAAYNILALRDPVTGQPVISSPIDFGDLSRAWVVEELTTAMAIAFTKPTIPILDQACAMLVGFSSRVNLTEAEVTAIWPLVCARACVLVVSALTMPYNPETDDPTELCNLLDRVTSVPFCVAEEVFRLVVGLPLSLSSERRHSISLERRFTPMLNFPTRTPSVLDFGVKSSALSAGAWLSSSALSLVVETARQQSQGVAIGAYGEIRLLYAHTKSGHFPPSSVHLGIDVFVEATTPVRSPCPCEVVCVDAQKQLVVLRVEGAFDIRLRGISCSWPISTVLCQGAVVGHVALTQQILPPHVHVQLAPLGLGGLVPGLCPVSVARGWMGVCPSPAALLGLTLQATQHGELKLPDSSASIRRQEHVASVQEHYFRKPPQIERGWQSYLIDVEGRAYLDSVNNVTVLGHCHPAVANVACQQLQLLNTNSRFVYESLNTFAQQITQTLPPGLDQVIFVNSGSEATDVAMRLARTFTGRRDVICFEGAYHGITTASDEVSTTLNDNPRSRETRPAWIHLVPMPNAYRGRLGPDVNEYILSVQETISQMQSKVGHGPAAFIAEPLSGNAGGVEVPAGYFKEVYKSVRASGGLCIADEVQVGYGRLGTHFWGFMEHGVVPDILTMAKAAGNGHPLGFVVTTKAIIEGFKIDGSFFSSAGGNPVSCKIGSTVLATVLDGQLQQNASRVGGYLREKLLSIQQRFPETVGCIHGHGLYMGVEIITDSRSRAPGTAQASAICDRMLELGVICHATGDYSNVLKCKPPLCFSLADADKYAGALELALLERQ